ncbi:MAG: glycosyltransferase family 4 protein [Chloroflexi bacterium]|nr:glycosyltransferase family 4 protein [Chloroflexota bacterium]
MPGAGHADHAPAAIAAASVGAGERLILRVGLLAYGLDRPLSGTTRAALTLGQELGRTDGIQVTYLTTYRDGPFRDGHAQTFMLPACARLPQLMALGGPIVAAAARALRLDVVHDPVGISPFTLGRWAGGFTRVVSIYDAIAFRYPNGYPFLNNLLHRRFIPATLRNVDGVITASQHACLDVMRFLHVAPQRVHVVPLAVGPEFRPRAADETAAVRARYGLEAPYVLSVGSQQERKNVPALIRAFAHVHRRLPDVRLAITGPTQWASGSLAPLIAELGIERAVQVLGYVPDDDLPLLYAGARVFAFPSLYEGFGLPPLEAMACGTPVVCSNSTSLPEVAGDGAAMLVEPTDVAALAGALEEALTDDALRCRLRDAGLERAGRFTWAETARQTVAAYRELAASRG